MKRCLDDWLLQAYADGELSPQQASEAAAHFAACADCADALAAVEYETSFLASSFAPDESLSVPTEILRARINAAVAQLELSPEANHGSSRGGSFGGLLATLSGLFTFTPQGAAAFAGLLAILAVATVLFVVQKSQQAPGGNQIAKNERVNPAPATPSGGNSNQDVGVTPLPMPGGNGQGTINTPVKFKPRHSSGRSFVRGVAPSALKENSLPGEKDYQSAIASLEKTIKSGGDAVLSPSVRVKYERNLALLDSAIGETRRVAAGNPKDKDAVGFLMSAYQSKVELLTKVAERAQVSALGR